MITRGTTPTLVLRFPFECSHIKLCSITIAQRETLTSKEAIVKIKKDLEGCSRILDNYLLCSLTEDETLSLDDTKPAEIQVRYCVGSSKQASRVLKVDVGNIVEEGHLE